MYTYTNDYTSLKTFNFKYAYVCILGIRFSSIQEGNSLTLRVSLIQRTT